MLVCVFLCAVCTRDRGCSAHPVFPAPSVFWRDKFLANLGRSTPREGERTFRAPSLRAKRSNPFFPYSARWIASLALAMTLRRPSRLRPHRLGRIGLRQRMRLGEFRQRHRGLEDALHRRPFRQIDLLGHRRGDMADQADVGERWLIAMREAAGRLVADEMTLERGERFHRPVPAPGRLLGVAQFSSWSR